MAEQNHWSERGLATSAAHADAPSRPRRSVLAFGVGIMSRYLPTLRGWIALLLAAFAVMFYPLIHPAISSDAGVGVSISQPVPMLKRTKAVVLLLLCCAASVEAYRRGSRVDKVVSVIAFVLTVLLMTEFLWSLTLRTHKTPNESAPGKGGSRSLFHSGRACPALPERYRSRADLSRGLSNTVV